MKHLYTEIKQMTNYINHHVEKIAFFPEVFRGNSQEKMYDAKKICHILNTTTVCQNLSQEIPTEENVSVESTLLSGSKLKGVAF